jgi:hypothetical protein
MTSACAVEVHVSRRARTWFAEHSHAYQGYPITLAILPPLRSRAHAPHDELFLRNEASAKLAWPAAGATSEGLQGNGAAFDQASQRICSLGALELVDGVIPSCMRDHTFTRLLCMLSFAFSLTSSSSAHRA